MRKRHFIIAAVTAASTIGAGLFWPVQSNAEVYYGPLTKANGQCWHATYGAGQSAVGYWGDCQRDNPELFRGNRDLHSDTQKGKNPYPNATR